LEFGAWKLGFLVHARIAVLTGTGDRQLLNVVGKESNPAQILLTNSVLIALIIEHEPGAFSFSVRLFLL
jgi:hypothetical protein